MDYCSTLFVLLATCSVLFEVEAMVTNRKSQVLEPWQDTVKEVMRSSTMEHVLQEYLGDIEIVEAAASSCALEHRPRHSQGVAALQTALNNCQSTANQKREALASCVEQNTRTEVSELRDQITRLKTCVDHTPGLPADKLTDQRHLNQLSLGK